MKHQPVKLYPIVTVTVTIISFGPKPKSRKPTAALVKVEAREGEKINDLNQRIRHLERAIESLQGYIGMYQRWQAQDGGEG